MKGRLRRRRLSFKCEETAAYGISMHFLILSSVFLLLPVTPTATITCHSFSSLSTLHPHFPHAHPRLSPVILFIPFFSSFCRGFPPIRVHTSQVSARPYTLLLSLRGVAIVTGRMDDRQDQHLSAPPPLFQTPRTASWLPTNESHTSQHSTHTVTHTHTHRCGTVISFF